MLQISRWPLPEKRLPTPDLERGKGKVLEMKYSEDNSCPQHLDSACLLGSDQNCYIYYLSSLFWPPPFTSAENECSSPIYTLHWSKERIPLICTKVYPVLCLIAFFCLYQLLLDLVLWWTQSTECTFNELFLDMVTELLWTKKLPPRGIVAIRSNLGWRCH